MKTNSYDVVICGGGLAGLTLARQLRLKMPEISIAVIDRLVRPLPEAAFKVGESTVELGAYYLAQVLQLPEYFKEKHLPKLGLRFFFGNPQDLFQHRPELGLSKFHPPASYQIDRGRLENDLRTFNVDAGIELLENCSIQDIELAVNTERSHQIFYRHHGNKKTESIQARWAIDAMGRRRFLQKKLGLTKPNNPQYSSAWFWLDGRLDVSDFVPETERWWHSRVPNKNRYYSTNHLCGEGYWIWLIPLSSDATSIGIVTNGEVHPFKEYHSYERAYQWLEKHEPVLAEHLQDKPLKKFMKMPQYNYSSSQVFSINRWACVGESGVFPDPFYSPGTDLIGFGNSLTTQMIELDIEGKLTQQTIDDANRFYLSYSNGVATTIQNTYPCFGNGFIMANKVIWDILAGWAFAAPLMFNSLFLAPEKRAKVRKRSGEFSLLAQRVQQLFLEWSRKSLGQGSFEFIDYLEIPFIKEVRSRNLKSDKTEEELIDDDRANLELLEELAQVIFLLALEDTMPEKLEEFPSPVWLNAWAISLDVNRWERDRLFKPKSKPRDLRRVMSPLRGVLKFNLIPIK